LGFHFDLFQKKPHHQSLRSSHQLLKDRNPNPQTAKKPSKPIKTQLEQSSAGEEPFAHKKQPFNGPNGISAPFCDHSNGISDYLEDQNAMNSRNKRIFK
jgi:hypothetical protein